MNVPVVLDTNALICLFRGESEDVKHAVMGASRIVIPLTVFGEFMAGIEAAKGRRRSEADLFEEFLAVPNTAVNRPSEVAAHYYAKIFACLRRQGTPIPANDIWIAAETMEVGGRLVSLDGHFSNVPMLNWTKCE